MLTPAQLADLGCYLRGQRFTVSPAQLNDAARLLLEAPGLPAEPQALSAWLAPLLCSDADQQLRFPALYRQWLRARGMLPPEPPAPDSPPEPAADRRRRPRGLAVMAVLVLAVLSAGLAALGALAWDRWQLRTLVVEVSEGGRPLPLAAVDWGGIRAGLTDTDGRIVLSYRQADLPRGAAVQHPERRDVSGAPLRAVEQVETPPAGPLALGFEARAEAPPAPSAAARPLRSLPPLPDLPGTPTSVEQSRTDLLRLGLLIGAALAPLLGWALEWLRRRGVLERLPADGAAVAEVLRAARALVLSALRMELRRLGRELRRRVLVASRELDLPASLQETLARGGRPALVFGTRVEPDYLVLVDRAAPGDHLARLADEMVRDLAAQGVAVERYRFDADLGRCWPAPLQGPRPAGGPQQLDLLAGRHPGSRLLLVTDGRGLIDAPTGRPVPALSALRNWERPLLLTPVPRRRWGRREGLLQRSGLTLLSLDAEGLLLMAELLARTAPPPTVPVGASEPRPIYQRDLELLLDRRAPDPVFVERLVRALRDDLESEDGRPGAGVGFAWLCALAVYPELHWGVTLVVGDAVVRALAPDQVDDKRVHAQRLARLARLPWLRHSHMPDWLREALIDQMPPAAEQAVRATLDTYLDGLSRLQGDPSRAADAAADPLRIARDPRDTAAWRDAWRGLRSLFRPRAAAPPAAADLVYLRFLEGRPRRTSLRASRHLRRLLYRDGVPLAGARLGAPLLVSALVVGLAWAFPPQHVERVVQDGLPRASAAQLLAYDRAGTRLAAADEAGDLWVATGGDGWQAMQGLNLAVDPGDRGLPPWAEIAWFRTGAERPASVVTAQTAATWTSRRGRSWPEAGPGDGSDTLCALASADPLRLILLTRGFLQRTVLDGRAAVLACAISAGGRQLAVAADDGSVTLVPLGGVAGTAGRGPVARVMLPTPAMVLAVDDAARTLAAAGRDGRLRLVRGTGRVLEDLAALPPDGAALALTADGRTLAATQPDRRIQEWTLEPSSVRRLLLSLNDTSDGALATVLRDRYGFEERRIAPGDGVALGQALDAAVDTLAADDQLVLHLGRGTAVADPPLPWAALAQRLAQQPARQVLVLSDAAMPVQPETAAAGAPATARVLLAPADGPPGTLSTQVARVLGRATAPLPARELATAAAALQTAEERRLRGPLWSAWPAAGHGGGDLVFTPLAERAPVVIPDPGPILPAGPGTVAADRWDLVWSATMTDRVSGVAVSRDGRLVAAVSWADELRVWDTASGRQLSSVPSDSWGVAFAATGETLYATVSNERPLLQAVDARSGRVLRQLRAEGYSAITKDVAVSPDGQWAAMVGTSTSAVTLLDLASGRTRFTLPGRALGDARDSVVEARLRFAPDGRWLAVLLASGALTRLDVRDGAELASATMTERAARGLAVSPDGTEIATCGVDEQLRLWEATRLQPRASFKLESPCSDLAYHPDGASIVVAGLGGFSQRIRRTDGSPLPFPSTLARDWIQSLAISGDGRWIVVGASDRKVYLHRVDSAPDAGSPVSPARN